MESTAKCMVFLGPSLPREEARRLYPDCMYRAPIRRGDLDDLAPGTVVGLIDGVFEQELAVSPREVHQAVQRGVAILGSSSMGAMRAAEVQDMVGVGKIYTMFKNGIIERDDEVALLFDPDNLRPLTQPLVNVRYALERLRRSGSLDAHKASRLLEAARALHFRERTYPRILREAGLDRVQDRQSLLALLDGYDLKAEDARRLLEVLPAFREQAKRRPIATGASARVRREHEDALSDLGLRPTMPEDAPVLIWEYGDPVSMTELCLFMKLCGEFRPAARRAMARYLLQGNLLELPESPPREAEAAGKQRQALLMGVMARWGWYTAEETRVTCQDLGLGIRALLGRLAEEQAAQDAEEAFAQAPSPEFLEALRTELVMDGLALKRLALRFGAVQALARLAHGNPSTDELRQAQGLACQLHGTLFIGEVRAELSALGVDAEALAHFVEQIALVRRAIRQRNVGWPPTPASIRGAVETVTLTVGPSPKAAGDPRFCLALSDAETHARRIAPRIGITRVAMIGELDDLGIQVSQAYRPHSPWSTTAGSGKSETVAGARVGGVLEEIEKYAQECYQPQTFASSYRALLNDGVNAVDPHWLDLPFDSSYQPDLELAWAPTTDLLNERTAYVPAAVLCTQRLPHDPCYSPRRGEKVFMSSGLASGFTLEEALTHALCELIERHAQRLAELSLVNPGAVGSGAGDYRFVDLTTAPVTVQQLAARLTRHDYSLRVLDITSEVRVPSFEARLYRLEEPHVVNAVGSAAHPNAAVALQMAMLEAAQTKIGNVSGAREDLAIAVRSLGRHERPRPLRAAFQAFWYGPTAPFKALADVPSFVADDALADLNFVLSSLRRAHCTQALATELSTPVVAPVRVVRTIVPGLESANPFYTGPRARALALADLLAPIPHGEPK